MPELEPRLDALDRRLIVATQAGLPRVSRPYEAIGAEVGIAGDEVIARLRRMLEAGVIRRIGAVPNHYAIGYTANGMSVWDVDDASIDELGVRVGALDFVTHCYRRPRRLPDWPYNLYCMVHGRSREDAQPVIERLGRIAGRPGQALFSTRRFKQCGARYFSDRAADHRLAGPGHA